MKPITVGDVIVVYVNRRCVAAIVKAIHDDYLIVRYANKVFKMPAVQISRESIVRKEWLTS